MSTTESKAIMEEEEDQVGPEPESSSESDEEIEVPPEDEQSIMALQTDLQQNPLNYENHLQLIGLLRKYRLKETLRKARQDMHRQFPLSESLWLQWFEDELEQVKTEKDVANLEEMFKKAVQDYLSVAIWVEYLSFVRDYDVQVRGRTAAGLRTFRSLCEEAITAVGLHVTEGHKVWDIFREFEMVLEGEGAAGQEERVRSVFHRQLAVPLVHHRLEEYRKWEEAKGKDVPEVVQKNFEKAQAAVELRRSYEAAMTPDHAADATLLAMFLGYIKLEQLQGDPARVQCVFERSLAMFPVTVELWYQYTRYLEAHLRIPGIIQGVYCRAVRNCPWVGELWARRLRALERGKAEQKEIQAVYEAALKAGLQGPEDYLGILLARADYLRRQLPPGAPLSPEPLERLRAHFKSSWELMSECSPAYLDLSLRLPAYWSHWEVHVAKAPSEARAVWENLLKGPYGRYYEVWSAYVNMERSLRNISEARAIFRRGYSRKMEAAGQVALCMDWLRFEREEGSVEDYFSASLKVEPILAEATAQAAAAAVDPQTLAEAKAAVNHVPQLTKEEVVARRREKDPNFKMPASKSVSHKRVRDEAHPAEDGQEAKRQDVKDHIVDKAPIVQDQQHVDGTDAAMEEAPADTPHHEHQEQRTPHTVRGHRDSDNTVFVKHLAMSVTEGDLRGIFEPCGGLLSVRLMKKPNGESKGFAYLDFATAEGVARAVQMDRMELQGKHIFVAKSAPPSQGAGGRGEGRGGRAGGRGHGPVPIHQRFNPGHMRKHLDIGGPGPTTGFVPRALAARDQPAAEAPPQSNEDFRKLLLKK